ncbi:MAG TPA: hypothetical protein VKU41_06230, partial [Polyangiaceae bacterium]|nr:hypothetical protein [Polyangiaceae bacterium]
MAKQRINWTLTGSAPAGVRRLGRDDFTVVFQPIVELSTGRAIAHEALVRCKDVEYPTPVDLFEAAA